MKLQIIVLKYRGMPGGIYTRARLHFPRKRTRVFLIDRLKSHNKWHLFSLEQDSPVLEFISAGVVTHERSSSSVLRGHISEVSGKFC